jgi:hypothetical protein
MDDAMIEMALTCSGCGTTMRNDHPRSQMPDHLSFLQALRVLGWSIPASNGVHSSDHRCPKCVSSS